MNLFKRKIPSQRGPLPSEAAPDRSALRIKAARRQAYRYGQQLRGLTAASDEHTAIGIAWSSFLAQFDDQITRNYLTQEFNRGVQEFDMQHKDDWTLV